LAGNSKLGFQVLEETSLSTTPLSEAVWENLTPESARRVVAAAIKCFAEFGFHGTSTRTLATHSYLSPGGIYVHFESKLDLLEFIAKSAHEELATNMLQVNVIEDPSERLTALVRAHVHFHALRATAAHVANVELHSLPYNRRAEIMTMRAVIDGLLTTAVEDGVKSGDFQVDDIRPVVFGIISMGLGLTRWYHVDGSLSPDEIADIYARAALAIVKNHSPRPR
jgi:AcrR family transcriptional regulator